jgi:tetratricopeptide (TPR) repeat protein
VDKSLLRRGGDGRYDLHELVRQYAAEKLREQPDGEARAVEHHATYFLGFLQEHEDRLNRDRLAVEEVRFELEDIRSAWMWALREGRLDLVSLGAGTLARFYRLTGLLREGEVSFDLAVERVSAILQAKRAVDGAKHQLLARLQVELAGLLNERARYTQASETAHQAADLAKTVGDPRIEAAANLEWGISLWHRADFVEARLQIENALSLARPAGAPRLVANILAILGAIDFSQGRISEALSSYRDGLELFRKSGDRHGESGVLNRLGTATCRAQAFITKRPCRSC